MSDDHGDHDDHDDSQRVLRQAEHLRQAEQAVVCSRLLIGIGRGLIDSGMPPMAIVLGLGSALEFFATVLINRSYHESQEPGAQAAVDAITRKLTAIGDTCVRMQGNAERLHNRTKN